MGKICTPAGLRAAPDREDLQVRAVGLGLGLGLGNAMWSEEEPPLHVCVVASAVQAEYCYLRSPTSLISLPRTCCRPLWSRCRA